MRILIALLISTSCALGLAQESAGQRAQEVDQPQRRAPIEKAELIKRFDKDGDGELSAEEATAARRALAAQPANQPQNRDYRTAISIRDPKDFKVAGGKEIFSGPQAGEILPKLNVTAVGGDNDGKAIDALGNNSGLQVLILSDQYGSSVRGLIGLTRFIGTINDKSNIKLNAIVVYLGDDTNQLAENAKKYGKYVQGNPTIGLSRDGREGPGSYGLDRNVSMTIIVAEDGKVKYNFPFPQGMLTPDPHVLGAISEIIQAKPEKMREWLAASYPNRSRDNANARPNGVDVRALIAPVLNKEANDEQIDNAAKRIDVVLEKNKVAAAQLGSIAKRIIDSGNLANYGTERSQYHLFKWAKLYGGTRPATEREAQQK